MTSAFISGFSLGASLIIAIGAQNAFVLRQGIKRERVFAVAAVSTLCDWALITLGAAGFGALVTRFPAVTRAAALLGAAFLLVYGALAFRSAVRPSVFDPEAAERSAPRGSAVAAAFAVALLNPHVYLDTVVLLGSVAAQYGMPPRALFALGAGSASFVWFFGLAYGARMLAPLFERPAAWRALDTLVGVVMWWIAVRLLLG